MRRTATLDLLLPLLYLKGISTGDFQSVLEPLLGPSASSVSPGVISRLKETWYADYQQWNQRDLSKKRSVYWWADGVYLKARMESEKSCVLVIIGVDEYGKKELIALNDGFRESQESWIHLMEDLKGRGLQEGPQLAVGDGAMGFWGALEKVFPHTQHQRCWVHKIRNVLNKLPKSQQPKAKAMLQEIHQEPTREQALKSLKRFVQSYQLKYPKAAECLEKDTQELLAYYQFPAEHWVHLRTTNPIESTFATVRHRTKKSKNCFSRTSIIAAAFKLMIEAQKNWRTLKGHHRLPQVIRLESFIDGIHHNEIRSAA